MLENLSITTLNTGIFHMGTRYYMNKKMLALCIILVICLISYCSHLIFEFGKLLQVMDYQINFQDFKDVKIGDDYINISFLLVSYNQDTAKGACESMPIAA